ncbi:MAG: hypothetical protein IH609_17200 [Dehalococcoidia bacterium]|nr:hypothetical protein [Dehalococcoidia bacterium]
MVLPYRRHWFAWPSVQQTLAETIAAFVAVSGTLTCIISPLFPDSLSVRVVR